MLEFFIAGGWLMYPLLICLTLATAIVVERFWSLQTQRISPPELITQIWQWLSHKQVDKNRIQALATPCIIAVPKS